jgi:hypothetical protein
MHTCLFGTYLDIYVIKLMVVYGLSVQTDVVQFMFEMDLKIMF